ncbi:MAG: insulinase family protein, partial [Ginsengibacter sp.]
MIQAPDRSIAPPIKDAIEFNLLLKPCEKFSLNNGAPVFYLNDGAEEVVLLEFMFYAGNSFENKNLVAAATNHLIKNGTAKKTALEINEHFDYYGSYFSRSTQSETATITLHCLSKHLKELLPMVREIFTESVFPQQELEIFQQNSIQRLLVSLQKSEFVAGRLIDKYLYGEKHPYGRMSSADDINALDRNELLDFYKHFYIDAKCLIFAAGRLPADFQE